MLLTIMHYLNQLKGNNSKIAQQDGVMVLVLRNPTYRKKEDHKFLVKDDKVMHL